eukprot:5749367-Alexandrium_andersonii.AAC.1
MHFAHLAPPSVARRTARGAPGGVVRRVLRLRIRIPICFRFESPLNTSLNAPRCKPPALARKPICGPPDPKNFGVDADVQQFAPPLDGQAAANWGADP